MERLDSITRRALERCKRAMEARKDGSERREGSEELKKPERSADDAQHPGSYRAGGVRGLELDAGEFVGLRDPMNATMRSPATNADTYRYDFTSAGYSVRVRFTGDSRWFDLRAVPRRAWLGGGDPLPRPSSRLLIANNDNRHAGDLGPRGSFTSHSIGTSTFR
jgi:hypothetical protein